MQIEQDVRRGHYLEDFEIGRVFRHHWGRTMLDYDAVLFSNLTTQHNPMYFNVEYAKALGHPGIPIHPLWIACIVMGLAVEDLTEIGGPFLGVDDLELHHDVYPGDTIYSETEVLAKRESSSRPGWGIVTWDCRGVNQRDEVVISFARSNMARSRNNAA